MSDLDDVGSIRQSAIARHAPGFYSEREVDELLRQAGEAGFRELALSGRLFVATCDELLVGTAAWADGYVRHVHVRPGYERSGIGTLLVRRVEQDIRRFTRATEMLVNATRNAEPFYEAIGFARSASAEADSTLFVLMRKAMRR